MRNFRIPRRSFLRGLGGVAIALPALEAMTGRFASAAPGDTPLRYLYTFAGMSTGRKRAYNDAAQDLVAPDQVGLGYVADKALTPLATHGVAGDVSVVTGMVLPWANGGNIPAGGRVTNFHSNTTAPLVSGVRSDPDSEAAQGPSSDEVVAQAIAGDASFRKLSYRVQAAYYRGSNGSGGARGRITYERNDNGNVIAVDPVISPRLAYESLFAGFLPADPEEVAQALALLDRRVSALDLVKDDTDRLLPNLGASDRVRLEQHLDRVRELEQRLAQIEDPIGGACEQFPHPGEDPPIGNANGNAQSDDDGPYSTTAGYSNEDLRAQVLFDLVHMAFACDLSRVASVMMTMAQCFMNLHPVAGHETDFHQASHHNHDGMGPEVMTDAIAWHVDHFARLVEKLRDTTDFDGLSLLDNCAVILQFEGGYGYDPQTSTDDSPHSTENMSTLIAGGAGGLNASGGRHVRTNGAHPVQVVNTAMRAVGVDQELGEVTGTIDELVS